MNDIYHTSSHTKLLKPTSHRIREKRTLFVSFFFFFFLVSQLRFICFSKITVREVYFKYILFLLYLTKLIFNEKSSKLATCVFFMDFSKLHCDLFKFLVHLLKNSKLANFISFSQAIFSISSSTFDLLGVKGCVKESYFLINLLLDQNCGKEPECGYVYSEQQQSN